MDFPAELWTNSCALEGSSNIAYAICVPTKTGISGVPDAVTTGPESWQSKGANRLRRAENELRRARVLVSLDQAKGELFTFYRKEDLQRESKSIYNCVMTILRKNQCHTSFKNAIKTADLLRPDHARLHRLFLSAILCMTSSVVKQEHNLVALDLNTFLFRVSGSPQRKEQSFYESGDIWRMLYLTAQLFPDGKVLAINHLDTLTMFTCVSSICHKDGCGSFLGKPRKVMLALAGQYARYVGGYLGRLPRPCEEIADGASASERKKKLSMEKCKQRIWKDLMEQWLAENELSRSLEEGMWIEVEVPFCDVNLEHGRSAERFPNKEKALWKPIFWPASLCYVDTIDRPFEESKASSFCFEDPLHFVEDWVLSAADREFAIRKLGQDVEVPMGPDGVRERDATYNNGTHLDAGQSFRHVTSLDGQGAATIYPTPPDGALPQVTPAVSYVDGTGTTPAEGAIVGPAERAKNNTEMMDLVAGQAGIGSGLYDEDLFEDVPREKFGETEMADEPNWDFFDQPDGDMVEIVDHMEVDIPQKAIANAEDQNSTHGEVGDIKSEPRELLGEGHDTVTLSNSKTVHDSRSMTLTQEQRPYLVEKDPKDEVTSQSRLFDTISQPLSQIEDRQKLFPTTRYRSLHKKQQTNDFHPSRRSLVEHHFDWNSAQTELRLANSRYSENGLFWFELDDREREYETESTEKHHHIPTVGTPKKEPSDISLDRRGRFDPLKFPSTPQESDFDSSDFFSEGNKDDSPERSDGDDMASSIASPPPADDVFDSDTESRIRAEALEILELLRPEINEQSSRGNYQSSQMQPTRFPLSRENLLTVAQVMVDQVSQSFFSYDHPGDSHCGTEVYKPDTLPKLQSIYGDATELDLAKLAGLSMSTQDAAEESGLVKSAPPFIRVARGDVNVAALPTIQPFWEILGLQPVSGRKNITGICIHPTGAHIREGSSSFLQRFSEIYSNCNLGSHTAGILQGFTSNGLVEWDTGKDSGMHELLRICGRLGSALSILPASAENLMIYIVNPFQGGHDLADICGAFVALFTNYAMTCGNSKGNELNLQVIPMSFIASSDTVVIPCQAEYLSLALEVYNRCPLPDSSEAIAPSGAAVTLAEPVPKDIVFRLTPDDASPLSKDRKILHLAYSQSIDLRWISACWTDNLGNIGLTMTYCLRHKGSTASRPRSEVIKEMWEISKDIMIKTRAGWHLSVAHDGAIEPDEINEWSSLASQNTANGSIPPRLLILLTFNEHPSIQMFPPPPPPSPPSSKPQAPSSAAAAAAAGKYGTPASTPSAATMTSSPEHLTAFTPFPPTPGASGVMTAPTPPDQSSQTQGHTFDLTIDPHATLVDPIDECWSLVLPFGLNNSNNPLEGRPALRSGFLIKRRGPLDSDGVVGLGVNLIYYSSTDSSPSEQKALLRDVIGQWRGLYTLARTKSLAGLADVLPWHIRTATRGCRAVSEVL